MNHHTSPPKVLIGAAGTNWPIKMGNSLIGYLGRGEGRAAVSRPRYPPGMLEACMVSSLKEKVGWVTMCMNEP